MTVKQLIAELNKHPDNMDVYLRRTSKFFEYSLTNEVYTKDLTFSEEPNSEPLCSEKVLIIEDI